VSEGPRVVSLDSQDKGIREDKEFVASDIAVSYRLTRIENS